MCYRLDSLISIQLPQMKDKSIHPPMKVPIPRAGNPALTERAYIPEDVTLISRPAPTPTLPISEHGGELFIVSSAFSCGSSNLSPPPNVNITIHSLLQPPLLTLLVRPLHRQSLCHHPFLWSHLCYLMTPCHLHLGVMYRMLHHVGPNL